ncbi:uncharacterized protein N0V89_000794 [Didymosphaeria variabile]|uniref:Uncharacterized protein n=1 Tax=Didymosphaeria variabile TaxID=1932322 RepID=A0A9W8XUZ8_9PLEO|nr:uncharacterized protein N0V89_000794 [Didymosphaeria variabile]KAJ4360234.1 hypothetical protein N0V89_000794 [Didymosphaeria variabile]
MSPTKSGRGVEDSRATVTPKDSEPQTKTTSSPRSEQAIGNPAPPNKLPPTKLSLELRSMPTKPTPETTAPRRSCPSGKPTTKHESTRINNEAPRKEYTAKEQKNLQPELSAFPPVMGASRPSRQLADVATGHIEGSPIHDAANMPLTSRRGVPLLAIKPGNVNDPIDVDALPSPHSPHSFANRSANYYTPFPLQYRPSRPSLPPTLYTPNGAEILSGKVSGHQSHDIYRHYVDMKDAPAPPGFAIGCAKLSAEVSAGRSKSKRLAPNLHMHPTYVNEYGQVNEGVVGQPYAKPLQMRYQSFPHDYRAHTTSYHTPIHGHPIFPVLNEEHLRKRAVQLVLDHSRPRSRKRRLSDDPDETSSSEYEDADEQPGKKVKISSFTERPATPSRLSDEVIPSTPSTGISEDHIFDRKLKLAELVEHTQLLTAMLMTYPRSSDCEGMREDIAMLATVTDKRLASWVSAESEFERDTRQRLNSAATLSPNICGPPSALINRRKRDTARAGKEKKNTGKKPEEDEIRRYLSVDSKLWDNNNNNSSSSRKAKAVEDGGVSSEKESGESHKIPAFETRKAATTVQHAALPADMA